MTNTIFAALFVLLLVDGLHSRGYIYQPAPPKFEQTDIAAIRCLALNVYHEARGEPLDGQRAVAHVTINRVESDKFPNDVCDVVYQRKQFSWTWTIKDQTPRNRKAWRRAFKIAADAYFGFDEQDPVNGATHYHAKGAKAAKKWNHAFNKVASIGDHIFYR